MNATRKRKLSFYLFALSILLTVGFLMLYALRQNISLFYTPSELKNATFNSNRPVRLGGMVVKGSVTRLADGLTLQFELTDFKEKVPVYYKGPLPDLFREGQGIVAQGQVNEKKVFVATQVLAKHDANYMPAELKKTLAKNKREKSA